MAYYQQQSWNARSFGRKLLCVKLLPKSLSVSRLIVLRVLLPLLVACSAALAQKPTLKGVVVDAVGAMVSNAHVQIIGPSGELLVGTFSQPDGTFEITVPAKPVTLTVYAQGVGRFSKELTLEDLARTERLEAKLTIECLADIKQFIPKKIDLRHFLVEIHYYGAFGDCPEKTYRLWGAGEASVTYFACGGKTFRDSRFIDSPTLASALADLAKEQSTPVCNYYAGGIDTPRVELTIFSGSEPRLVISHDEGDELQGVSELERKLEKIIDPDSRMQSFGAKADKKRRRH